MGRKGFLKKAKYMAVCVTIGIVLSSGKPAQASSYIETDAYMPDIVLAKDDIASGTNNGYKWVIDRNGTLTIRKANKTCDLSADGWKDYKDKIVKIDVDVPYSSHLKELFKDCDNVTEARVKIDKTKGSAESMFRGEDVMEKLDVSKLNTAGITDMTYMFYGSTKLQELDLHNWNTSNVTTMHGMFDSCYGLSKLDISGFSTKNVTDMGYMFCRSGWHKSDFKLDVSMLNTANVTRMDLMLFDLNSVVGYENFDTRNVVDMHDMFWGCELESIDLSKWDTSSLENTESMFASCEFLTKIDLGSFNTSKVKTMRGMFAECKSLESLDLGSFRTNSLQIAERMFYKCESLKTLDLSNFDMQNVNDVNSYGSDTHLGIMLEDCDRLEMIKTPKNVKIDYYVPRVGYEWYRDDTNEKVYFLPKNLSKSVTLHRQEYDNPFVDVRMNSWQYEGAKYAYDNHIMAGKAKTNGLVYFDVVSPMTRAEFVQTLFSMQPGTIVKYEAIFTDVPKGKWYTDAIIWAAKNKIVSGKGNIFDVEGKITRQEMVVMLFNYAKYKKMDASKKTKLTKFADYKTTDSWAMDAMKWAVANKIINGKTGKVEGQLLLDPKGTATRGEGASILKNFMEAGLTK